MPHPRLAAPNNEGRGLATLALLVVPCLAALPIAGGHAQSGTLGLFTTFVQHHAWLSGSLTMPERAARGFGQAILAIHVVLQIAGGLAMARFLRHLGCQGQAAAGGVLYELGPIFAQYDGTTADWALLGAASALPMVLAATEGCVAPLRSGFGAIVALVSAVTVLGLFADRPGTQADLAFAGFWAVARVATVQGERVAVASRLIAGFALGVALARPDLLAHVLNAGFGTAPTLMGALDALDTLDAWIPSLGSFGTDAVPHDVPGFAWLLIATLPALAISLLAVKRFEGAAALRIAALLALASSLAATGFGWWRHAQPVATFTAVLLAVIAIRDVVHGARHGVAIRIALLAMVVVVALVTHGLGLTPARLAAGAVAASALCLLLANARALPLALAASAASLFEAAALL